MGRYVLKRMLTGLLTIFVVLILNFLLIHLAPGDPIRVLAGYDHPSEQMVVAMQEKYGLNKPLTVQFTSYLGNLMKGDLGESIAYRLPVLQVILSRLGPSALLALTSAVLALVLGTLLGLIAARHADSPLDHLISGCSYFFYSMPPFWLGLMAILVFASFLKLLPTSGMVDLRHDAQGVGYALDVLRHMILPVGTLTLIQIPVYMRIFRTSVMHTMTEEFITTFRAAGMKEKKIFKKYILKNSILPTITVFGINLAYTVTGAALIEIVFAWPGVGRLMLDAISGRDYPLLMGIYLMLSVAVAVVMIALDIVYALVDPRIRYSK